jgi:hypothetical protein
MKYSKVISPNVTVWKDWSAEELTESVEQML